MGTVHAWRLDSLEQIPPKLVAAFAKVGRGCFYQVGTEPAWHAPSVFVGFVRGTPKVVVASRDGDPEIFDSDDGTDEGALQAVARELDLALRRPEPVPSFDASGLDPAVVVRIAETIAGCVERSVAATTAHALQIAGASPSPVVNVQASPVAVENTIPVPNVFLVPRPKNRKDVLRVTETDAVGSIREAEITRGVPVEDEEPEPGDHARHPTELPEGTDLEPLMRRAARGGAFGEVIRGRAGAEAV